MPIPYERNGKVAQQSFMAYNSTFTEAQREAGPPEFLTEDQLEELRSLGAEIGERVQIHRDAKIDFPQKLKLGDDVMVGPDVRIRAAGGIQIEERVILEPGVQLLSSIPYVPTGQMRISDSKMWSVRIYISRDCVIGTHAIVMPGVSIGEGTMVMPGSVIDSMVSNFRFARPGTPFRTIGRDR